MTESQRYIPAFDGSRGIAALFVLVAHYGFLQTGWVSVQYFFILSGFLITTLLLQQKETSLGAYLKTFFWRRSLRIFPVYFAFIGLCTVLYLLIGEPAPMGRIWPYVYTYTYNIYLALPRHPLDPYFSHLWSLSAEEQFYALWPFLIFFLRGKWMKPLVVGVLVAIPLVRIGYYQYALSHGMTMGEVGRTMYLHTLFQFDAFATGAAIALFGLQRHKIAPKLFVAVFAAALAYGIWIMMVHPDVAPKSTDGLKSVRTGLSFGFPLFLIPQQKFLWGYSLMNLLSGLFVITCCQANVLSRLLGNKFLVHVGKLSYGIYIVHLPLQALVRRFFPYDLHSPFGFLMMFPFIALVLTVAHLSYTYFELRFIAIKNRRGAPATVPVGA